MNRLLKCKLMMLTAVYELFFKDKQQMITEIRKLQSDCEKVLEEGLELYFENNTITCFDSNDLTIFRCEYERLN